jgi:serine/threonine protein kinase
VAAATEHPDPDKAEVERLLAELLDLHESSGVAAVERALAAHPKHAAELRRHLGRLLGLFGADDSSQTATQVPERIGDYRLLQRLGGGGMGVVYLAEQQSLGRHVALKLIRPELLWFGGSRERFGREAAAVARLQHPGIVPVYAAGEDQGVPWMAMAFVEGATLDDVLQHVAGRKPETLTGREFDEALAAKLKSHLDSGSKPTNFAADAWVTACIRIARDVARALEHAHRSGVLHRDVKPANVMLSTDGRAQLLDFGLAVARGAPKLTASHSALGSPAYMSPEQLRAERDLDGRTDVYSLGLTLYELLSLHAPYAVGSSEKARTLVLDGAAQPVRARNPAVPRDLAIVCHKAMSADRRDRYVSAQAFADDLDNILASRPIDAAPPGIMRRAHRWTRRHPAWAVSITASIAIFFVAPSVFWLQQRTANEEIRTALAAARRDRDRGREAVSVLLQQVANEELFDLPRMQGVRQRLLLSAREFHERFLADGEDGLDAAAQAADSGLQVATLSSELGHAEEAMAAADRAVQLAEQTATSLSAGVADRVLCAKALTVRGKLRMQKGDAAAARSDLDRASAILQAVSATDPAHAAIHVISTEQARAFLLRQTADADALEKCQRAMDSAWDAIQNSDGRLAEKVDAFERYFVASCDRAAVMLQRGDNEGALSQLGHCEALLASTDASTSQSSVVRRHRIRIETMRAVLAKRADDLTEAERRYRLAIDGYAALLEQQPESTVVLRLLSTAQNDLGVLLPRSASNQGERLALLKSSVATLRRLVDLDPSALGNRVNLAAGLANLAVLHGEGGDQETAYAELGEARAAIEEAIAKDPGHESWAEQLFSVSWHQALAALAIENHYAVRECAARIANQDPLDAKAQLLAAELISRSISLLATDDALSTDYATQAIEWLSKAAELGCAQYEFVRDDEAFDPLRVRTGFRAALARIQDNQRNATKSQPKSGDK